MGQTAKILIASVIIVLALTVFGTTFVRSVISAPDTEIPVPQAQIPSQPQEQSIPAEMPARLIIPALNVNAKVQQVGINQKGNMSSPTNFTDVGWYKYGAAPGQNGSAVIDGHVDNGLSLPGVFKHLIDLNVGDQFQIQTETGRMISFQVIDKTFYDYKNAPTQDIFRTGGSALVRLITCEGKWVSSDKTYNQRLVITGEMKPTQP